MAYSCQVFCRRLFIGWIISTSESVGSLWAECGCGFICLDFGEDRNYSYNGYCQCGYFLESKGTIHKSRLPKVLLYLRIWLKISRRIHVLLPESIQGSISQKVAFLLCVICTPFYHKSEWSEPHIFTEKELWPFSKLFCTFSKCKKMGALQFVLILTF